MVSWVCHARLACAVDHSGVVIALFVWLRIDIRDLRTDVRDVRDRLARLEGRIDGSQDQQRPPVA